MSRKNKFDLTSLVREGQVKDGDTLYFVSDPSKTVTVTKMPNGECKVKCAGEVITVFSAAQRFLLQDPPDHAAKWLRTDSGKTLYELWQADLDQAA